MIAALTLNPSLDYALKVDPFVPGTTNRSQKEFLTAGGKGINAARILTRLGLKTVSWGFIAGFVGEEIERQLTQERLPHEMIRLSGGNSRINVKLLGQTESEINAGGPVAEAAAVRELCQHISSLPAGAMLVLSGSLPPMDDEDAFWRLLEDAVCRQQLKLTIDMELSVISARLRRCRPFLIKPNRQELETFLGRPLLSVEEIPGIISRLQEDVAENVMLSLGAEGAFLAAENGNVYHSGVLHRPVESAVGAGDSMVAGFLYGYTLHQDPKEAFRWASACGNATAFSHGLADKALILSVFSELAEPEEVFNHSRERRNA